MYVPEAFETSEPEWCHALIRAEGFATLVTVDAGGVPFATHAPLLLDERRGPLGTLLGHVARANPQWRVFTAGRPALAVFQGPHAYISPTWYEAHPSVPTWNYVAVHAYGVPAVLEDPARVTALLARLTRTYESGRPNPWTFESLTEEYVWRMIRAIVAFEIPIERLEGKAKLSQNRSAADQVGVRAGLEASGDPLANAVAALMGRAARP